MWDDGDEENFRREWVNARDAEDAGLTIYHLITDVGREPSRAALRITA